MTTPAIGDDAVERDGRRLSVSGEDVEARVDAEAIRHVVDVLVDNALHHGKGDINVVVHGDAATAAVDISDEGPARATAIRSPTPAAIRRTASGCAWRERWPSRRKGGWSWSTARTRRSASRSPSDARRRLPDAHLP